MIALHQKFLMNGTHSKILELNNGKGFFKWMVPKMVENLPTPDHSMGRRYTIGGAQASPSSEIPPSEFYQHHHDFS